MLRKRVITILTYLNGVLFRSKEFEPDYVIHFAAETHVDRSIDGPLEFINSVEKLLSNNSYKFEKD